VLMLSDQLVDNTARLGDETPAAYHSTTTEAGPLSKKSPSLGPLNSQNLSSLCEQFEIMIEELTHPRELGTRSPRGVIALILID